MISIVMPVYNKKEFVEAAIRSVLDQTYNDLELLVVDDGSTDGSERLVEQFEDKRLRIVSIPHSGVSIARNTGIRESRGEWVAFLDADDWWAPNFLEEMISAMRDFPEEHIFSSGRTLVYPNRKERYLNTQLPKDGETGRVDYIAAMADGLPPINASNSVFRHSLLEKSELFPTGMTRHEDHHLWLRLCLEEKVVFVNKPLSFYRKSDLTNKRKVFSAEDFQKYIEVLKITYSQLNGGRKKALERYMKNFISLSYIRHYGTYKPEERQALLHSFEGLLSNGRNSRLKALNWLPFSVYPLLKGLFRWR